MSWNGIAGIEMEAFNDGNSWLKRVTLHHHPFTTQIPPPHLPNQTAISVCGPKYSTVTKYAIGYVCFIISYYFLASKGQ